MRESKETVLMIKRLFDLIKKERTVNEIMMSEGLDSEIEKWCQGKEAILSKVEIILMRKTKL